MITVLMLMGLCLLGLGMALRRANAVPEEPEAADAHEEVTRTGIDRVLLIGANMMVAVGAASPVMAAIGYAEAGNAMLFPTILSMALLGLGRPPATGCRPFS